VVAIAILDCRIIHIGARRRQPAGVRIDTGTPVELFCLDAKNCDMPSHSRAQSKANTRAAYLDCGLLDGGGSRTVPARASLQTLLVVDDDLAFVFWLGFGLEAHGLQAVPAKNATAARALLGRIEYPLKAAIVNAALPGTSRLVKDLRRHQPGLRVISLGDGSQTLPGAYVVLGRPADLDAAAKAEWVNAILAHAVEVRSAP
jgi:hypothetical protein